MMTQQQTENLQQVLAASGLETRRTHPSAWAAEVLPGHTVKLTCDEDYLHLLADLGPRDNAPIMRDDGGRRLLEQAHYLGGNVKFSLTTGQRVHLESELFAPDLDPSSGELAAALAGIQTGIQFFKNHASSGEGGALSPLNPTHGSEPVDLKEVARLSGWPFAERDNQDLVFDLTGDPALRQAVLTVEGNAATRLSVTVDVETDAGNAIVPAFADLMLRVNALLLGPRAILRPSGPRTVAVLEKGWQAAPGPDSLRVALESLNVASHTVGLELQSIFAADVAAAYLEVGMSSLSHQQPTPRKKNRP